MEGDELVLLMERLRGIKKKLHEVEVAEVEDFKWVHREVEAFDECQDALKRLKKSPKGDASVPQIAQRDAILARLPELKDIRTSIQVS
jgi:multimeric flavodoxin WrbA